MKASGSITVVEQSNKKNAKEAEWLMGTLFDYIKWRGDLSFSEAPLNEVDSLIFSLLSYLDLKGIVPESHLQETVPIKAAANSFFARNPDYKKASMGLIVPKEIIKLFRELKDTRRFRNVNMRAYVNVIDTETEMQFSAITFLPDDETILVTYRGTDDTLIGWKENFNMSFLPVVPAQLAAVDYLHQAAAAFEGNIRVTGHSKGGNLAVYAAVHCDPTVQSRLLQVWNNDGPGFQKQMMESDEYLRMRSIIRTLVPQSAVVGMLLEHDEIYTVIKSKQSGVLQHNGLNWEVMGGSFVHLATVTDECKRTDRTVNEWIRMMTPEQREAFTEAIYQILSSENAMTLTEIAASKAKILAKTKELDPHVRKTIQEVLSALLNINTKNILEDLLGVSLKNKAKGE